MAYFYVKSGGTAAASSDAGRSATKLTGSFATLGAANYYDSIKDAVDTAKATPPVAGDFILCSDVHSVDYSALAANVNVLFASSKSNPIKVVSVDDTALDTYKRGAFEQQSSGSNTLNYKGSAVRDGVYFEGMKFTCGRDFSLGLAIETLTIFKDGEIGRTGATGNDMSIGTTDGAVVELVDTDISLSNSAQTINVANNGKITWLGGAFVGTAPTYLFSGGGNGGSDLTVLGVDLTAAGTYLCSAGGANDDNQRMLFSGCILKAVQDINNVTLPVSNVDIKVHNCDDSNTVYREYEQQYNGDAYSETTVIRADGANNGTTGFSKKIVTSTNAKVFTSPMRVKLADLWGDGTAISYGVEFVSDNVTFNDDELWIEVEYQDDLASLAFIETDRASNILATPVAQATSTETWVTTGLTTPVKQKCVVTLANTDKAGPVAVYACLAKPSSTVYACPKVEAL